MIRQIAPLLQSLEPPTLLYTKSHRLCLNDELRTKETRKRLPILVSSIAKHRTLLEQEHRMARNILSRHHLNFARPLVLSFLAFNPFYQPIPRTLSNVS